MSERSTVEPTGRGLRALLTTIGPGIAVAATGVGAGDLVAASVSGSRFGFVLVWTALAGAALKFALNEGLARWQLATGMTLLEGWVTYLGRWVQFAFLAYLLVWSFVVAGALISACGLAAHALVPVLSVEAWGVLHSLVAAGLVLLGGYGAFERSMKLFIGIMFVTLVGCAALAGPALESVALSVGQAGIPAGAMPQVLGVIGGVGGSVTMLSYGYWIRERGWSGEEHLERVRIDLGVAYLLTGLFGVAVMILAARVLHPAGIEIQGSAGALRMAEMAGEVAGTAGRLAFLVGFWGAVATSMLGVWQGVPYLFCDFVGLLRGLPVGERQQLLNPASPWYRGYLAFLAIPPMLLLFLGRPVGLIVVYAVLGALFMPFLAATLLVLNSRSSLVGVRLRSGPVANAALAVCLALFGYLLVREVLVRMPA